MAANENARLEGYLHLVFVYQQPARHHGHAARALHHQQVVAADFHARSPHPVVKVRHLGTRAHPVVGDKKVVYLIQKLHVRQHRGLPAHVAMNELGRVALALLAQHVEFQRNALALAQRYHRGVEHLVGLARGHVALHAAHVGRVGVVLVAQGFIGVVFRGALGAGGRAGAGNGRAEGHAGSGQKQKG